MENEPASSLTPKTPPDRNVRFKIRKPFLILLVACIVLLLPVYLFNSSFFLGKTATTQPTTAYGWYYSGMLLADKSQYHEAENSLDQALRLDPNLYLALTELGAVHSDQGNFIKAIPYFEKALVVAKTNKDTIHVQRSLYNLGLMYFYERKPEEAWKYLREANAIAKTLKIDQGPLEESNVSYHVLTGNKVKFVEQIDNAYADEIRNRIKRIRNLSIIFPKRALQDCEAYLTDNPGSHYTPDILLEKTWVLFRLMQHKKAEPILVSLEKERLPIKQKRWVEYELYKTYFNLNQFEKAHKALKDYVEHYPRTYSQNFLKYQESLIYKKKKDYNSEKKALEELIKISSQSTQYQGQNYSAWYADKARERLFEIYSAQRDYTNAFLEISSFYKPKELSLSLLSVILETGFFVLLFFIFSRVFFYKKIPSLLAGKFRLLHLWAFCVTITLIMPLVQVAFLGLNYNVNNALGRLRLDPFIIGMIAGDVLISIFFIKLLTKYYKIDRRSLGFFSRGIKFNFLLPLLALAITVLFGIGYEYFIRKVLYLDIGDYPFKGFMEQLKLQGAFTQKGLFIFFLTVATPISEEITFRIFLFTFLNQFVGRRNAVVITSLLFAVLHNSMLFLPYYFFIGLMLSALYLKTKSIIPSIVCHSLNNLLVVIFLPA